MKRLLLLIFVLVVIWVAENLYADKPINLFSLPLESGIDSLEQTAGRRVYALSDRLALVAGEAGDRGIPVYSGDVDELRWVIVRRGGDTALIASQAIFTDGERFLLPARSIPIEISGRPEQYWVDSVKVLNIVSDSLIINPRLSYDPVIAEIVSQVDSARLRAWVTAMQNFGTRHVRAANHAAVIQWIRNQFLNVGVGDVITDTFAVSTYGNIGHNIIATIPGLYDAVTIYLAGGHYDSYAISNAPGADDNASGAAAILEYARILSQPGHRPNSTVKLVCFDAEELGLWGSKYLSARMKAQGANLGCMLNFDMIGALDSAGRRNDSLFYSQRYVGSTAYAQLLIRLARIYGRHADTNVVGQYGSRYLPNSDSYPFWQNGYPVAWMMERYMSSVYHTPNDNTNHMNFRYLTGNVKGALGFLATLAYYPAPISGIQVQEHGTGTQLALVWRRATATNITGYRVYWGRASENYTGQMDVTDTMAIISGLMRDSLYYVAVAAVNSQNQESVFLREHQARPFAGTVTTVFFDDFESGLSRWTRAHSSGPVGWDTTSASYHSPNYSMTDSRAGNYANNVNSWIAMTNSLNLTGYVRATLSWWERYSTESGWDFCYPEISLDGGATWDSLFISKYSGYKTAWTQKSVDLTPLLPSASNFKIRFRLRTDDSIVDDGWYVDDVLITGYVPAGIESHPFASSAPDYSLGISPSPARSKVEIRYSLPVETKVQIDIYDVVGRNIFRLDMGVMKPGRYLADWNGKDFSGRKVSSGTYFIRLSAGGKTLNERVIWLR